MEESSIDAVNQDKEAQSQRPRPSECKICYRPGHGHHYGVASCKGCKTFFRRISISNVVLKCQLNNDCFDSAKRAQLQYRCQYCRYQKCIEVGMNLLELQLRGDEDQSLNYKETSEKRKEKEGSKTPKIQTIVPKGTLYKHIIDMLSHLELKIDLFKNCAYNPPFIDWRRTTEILITCGSKLSLADRLGPMTGWPLTNKSELPELSRMRDVPDLKPRFRGPNFVPEPIPTNEKMWMLFNMMTTVEYAKTFSFFQDLDLKDQVILIYHVTLICMNLHNSYFAVSRKMDKCMHPDGIELPQPDEFHYTAVSMAMAPLIRCDIQPVEYLLLKAICLCNPTVHGLSEHAQTVIAKERQNYADALLDTCLRNGTDGPSRFVELLGIISILMYQQKLLKDIHIYHIAPIISKYPFAVPFLDEIMYS